MQQGKNNFGKKISLILVGFVFTLALIISFLFFFEHLKSEVRPESFQFTGTSRSKPTSEYVQKTSNPMNTIGESQSSINRLADGPCYVDPKQALADFLSYLHKGDFEKAAYLYAIDYPFEIIQADPVLYNPAERQEVVVDFLAEFCWRYDTCLDYKIVNEKIVQGDLHEFQVIFYEQGKPFVVPEVPDPRITPVNTSSDGSRVSFRMKEIDGCFISLDTPPGTP